MVGIVPVLSIRHHILPRGSDLDDLYAHGYRKFDRG
jgi:hypothetical protein